jgi:MFS transporter, putative metabolite:H+ symporter
MTNATVSRTALIGVIVAALGFFVDLYDIIIFSAERTDSFAALSIPEAQWPAQTTRILNMQMLGMLIGGFIWGTIGDKFGRLKVLFGSILMYSIFTLLNAFVSTSTQFAWCRFFAGIGLAGELGAGITLVAEQIDKRYRGLAVSLVGGIGMLGAVTAGIVANLFSWRTSYITGAALGFALLLLRAGVLESGLFAAMRHAKISKGNFMIVLRSKKLLWKFICVLLVGMPGWFATGILITFTKEIAGSMGMTELPKASTVIAMNFLGFAFGDPLCGLLSQYLKSRKKAILIFLVAYGVFVSLFFLIGKTSLMVYYGLFVGMGMSVGFTIMLFTLAAEQFGANIRTLVTSASLNLTRGWVIPLSIAFTALASFLNGNYYFSALIILAVAMLLAFFALSQLDETYDKELGFYEE